MVVGCCLLPGVAYFIILMLALVGIVGPARWLAGMFSGAWSIPLLWVVLIGGPLLSAIGTLILGTGHRIDRRLDRIYGWASVMLLFFNLISLVPFPFILAIE